MNKRGPRPFAPKAVPLSVRVRSSTRGQLEEIVRRKVQRAKLDERKPTLSAEVDERLRQSLSRSETSFEFFGGKRMSALLLVLSRAMVTSAETILWMKRPTHRASLSGSPLFPEGSWLDDPDAFEQARGAALRLLDAVRPPGPLKASTTDRAIADEFTDRTVRALIEGDLCDDTLDGDKPELDEARVALARQLSELRKRARENVRTQEREKSR
jgi:hypothetical protein